MSIDDPDIHKPPYHINPTSIPTPLPSIIIVITQRTLAPGAVDRVGEARVVRRQVRAGVQHAVGDGVELLRVAGEPRHLFD